MSTTTTDRAQDLPPTFDPDQWVPPPHAVPGYRVSAFMRAEGIDSYQELYARATNDPEWFYPAAHQHLGVEWMRPWDCILDDSEGTPFARWFVGGGTNVAWLATRRHSSSSICVIWEGDDGTTRTVTGSELEQLVSQAAAGLRALGVARGDVVTIHLPMIPEAVVALLASARIGALSAPAFSGYAVDALAERIELGGAKVVITADGMLRRGKESAMMSTAAEACRRATTPPKLVVVPRYEAAIELGLEMDLREGDRMCWPSDMGWLTGPTTTVTPLVLGATAVLFEGVADYPSADRMWKMIERHKITHIGMPPTVGRMLAQAGSSWVEPFDLDSLRIIASTGEPWTENAWRWVHRNVGRGRVPIINWAGGTEVGGGILAGNPVVPTSACRFSGPALGKAADVVDEAGCSVRDQLGELVLRRSWPAMTRGFWNERERYLQSYWQRFPGLWVQGDRAIHHSDGTWSLPGRSDDVIKVAGKRIGPVEYESVATEVPGVVAAGAVGLSHPIKGEVPVIAVTIDPSQASTPDIEIEVIHRAEAALGKAMKPYAVVVVPELPLTRSGKIHRRALRSWLANSDPGDVSSVESLGCEDAIRTAGQSIDGLEGCPAHRTENWQPPADPGDVVTPYPEERPST